MNVSVLKEYIGQAQDNPIFKVVLGAIIAITLVFTFRKLIRTFFRRTDFLSERNEQTIESMFNSIIKYTATFGFIVYVLHVYGVKVGSILAGAGIISVIVGFGAQSIIRDLIAGVFLLYEKQLHQGDWVIINNTHQGSVEEIGLRFLKIREWSGALLTINNGLILTIANLNISKMRIIERVTISFYEDPQKVTNVLEQACVRLNNELDTLLKKDDQGIAIEPFSFYGMTSVNDGYRGYQYAITGLCKDDVYFTTGKQTRQIIAQSLYSENIQMAEQQVDLRNSNAKRE
ncbi:mechanosensitive ion channel family protein [Aquibacillus kalidii]|uniref:mechanosensitive ion channel family protein n=1 Tax=Aquibacillus kalidii TaxID=2762597 RepID=UPI001648D88B|nr:mechanosensitive ion channel family protein [Aquibacillus kalidii]